MNTRQHGAASVQEDDIVHDDRQYSYHGIRYCSWNPGVVAAGADLGISDGRDRYCCLMIWQSDGNYYDHYRYSLVHSNKWYHVDPDGSGGVREHDWH